MSGDIPPFVQCRQVGQSNDVCRVRAWKIKLETEALEIGSEVLEVWVAAIELTVGRELRLDQSLQTRSNSRNYDLGSFGVKIAAKSLEMRAQKNGVRAQVLVCQCRVRHRQGEDDGALTIEFHQAGLPVRLPTFQ